MKYFIILTILISTLYAQNPKVYTSLGDDIYNNVESIKELQKLKTYEQYSEKIDHYILDVTNTKKLGFDVESGVKKDKALEYLKELRSLEKVNNFFKKTIKDSLWKAMGNKDHELFSAIINNKMLDVEKYKKDILSYYEKNKKNIAKNGVIKKLLTEKKAKAKQRKKYLKTKKNVNEEKIERLRRNDKLDQEAFENRLEKEFQDKKEIIRKAQEKELFN